MQFNAEIAGGFPSAHAPTSPFNVMAGLDPAIHETKT
jgi:hypothetical protein